MAIVDLAIAATLSTQAFDSPGGAIESDTNLPVGYTWFTANTAIVVKGAGDETHIRCTMTFPGQYSYILKSMQIGIQMTEGTVHNFSQFGLINVRAAVPTQPATQGGIQLGITNQGIAFEFGAADVANPFRSYVLNESFHLVMQRQDGTNDMVMIIMLADEAAGASNAGGFELTACFWRYGVEQALHSPLNSPWPVIAY